MVFPENAYMVQTLAADGTDQSLHICVLPRTPRRRDDFLDLHSLHSQPKLFAIDLVTISKQEARGGLVGESLDDPLRGPRRRWMICHVEVQYATPVVRQHDEDIQHTKGGDRDGQEINRDQFPEVVVEKRAPGL
jgi:hypothetical protein